MTHALIFALASVLVSLTGQDPTVTQTELAPPGEKTTIQQPSPAPPSAQAQPAPQPAPQPEIAPVSPQQGIKTNEEAGPGRRVAAFWFIVPPRS